MGFADHCLAVLEQGRRDAGAAKARIEVDLLDLVVVDQ